MADHVPDDSADLRHSALHCKQYVYASNTSRTAAAGLYLLGLVCIMSSTSATLYSPASLFWVLYSTDRMYVKYLVLQ